MRSWTGFLLSALLLALPLPAGATSLSLNTYLQPPFSTVEGTGYFDAIVFELGQRTGIDFSIRNVPIKRGLTMTDQGLDDGHFPRVKSVADEHENLIAIPVPLYRSTFVAITKGSEKKLVTGLISIAYALVFILDGSCIPTIRTSMEPGFLPGTARNLSS